jgi:hypothetical protein
MIVCDVLEELNGRDYWNTQLYVTKACVHGNTILVSVRRGQFLDFVIGSKLLKKNYALGVVLRCAKCPCDYIELALIIMSMQHGNIA